MSVGLLVLLPGAATLGLEVISHALNLLPGVLGGVLQWIVALGVLTALVTMIFHWYPVQGPSWRASAFGAAFAGVAIAVGEWVLRTYVFKAVPSSPLGGALGLVPLVMLWVYVMWLCLLYGLELAVLIDRGRDQWRQRVRVTAADARPPTTAG